ncbi:MAG: DUF805 domain-containing protein [Candidatus Riflebacteria bacterium]|nr:DUF805 domain-containing protein [Candidatus Riflebacteria bacterium]
MNSILSNFSEEMKNCFCFKGTLNRERFWSYVLILFIPFYMFALPLFISGIILLAHFPTINVWSRLTTYLTFAVVGNYFLVSFIYFILTLGPSARRLRDAGYSPVFLILHFLFKPLGSLALIILFCLPTKKVEEVKQEDNNTAKAESNNITSEEAKPETTNTQETKSEEN